MAVKKNAPRAGRGTRDQYTVVLEDLRAQFRAFGEDLAGVKAKLEGVASTVEALDTRVEALDTKVEALDTKVEALDTKVEALDTKVEALDAKVHALDRKIDAVRDDLRAEIGFVKLAVLELAKDRRTG